MKLGEHKTILLLLGLFVVGFVSARMTATALRSPNPIEGSSLRSEQERKTRREAPHVTESKFGFEHALAELNRFESLFARGEFERLLSGEQANKAAWALAESDPEALWNWMQEHDSAGIEAEVYGPLIANWFKRDPEAALNARRLLSDWERLEASRSLVALLFDDDPAIAQAAGARVDEFFPEIVPDGDSGTPMEFYGGLASLEKLKALPESDMKATLLRSAMAGWFRKDWKAATTWAASRPDPERSEMERGLFAWGLNVQRKPETLTWAAAWLARPENRDLRARFGGQLAHALGGHNPATALAWATDNLSGAAKAKAVAAVVSAQVRGDRAAAFETVDSLPPGGVRLQSGRALITVLARNDPAAAYQRALDEERSGFHVGERAWGNVGIQLASQNPARARELLLERPSGLPGVFEARLLDYLGSQHAESTLQWAASASELDETRRSSITSQILRTWRRHDSVAAEKWTAASENE